MTYARKDTGFTLMEVLVALAIVGLGLAYYTRAMGDAYPSARSIKGYVATIATARSHLETVSRSAGIQAGEFSGTYPNRAVWHLTITELPNAQDPLRDSHEEAYWLALDVSDRSCKRLFKLPTASLR